MPQSPQLSNYIIGLFKERGDIEWSPYLEYCERGRTSTFMQDSVLIDIKNIDLLYSEMKRTNKDNDFTDIIIQLTKAQAMDIILQGNRPEILDIYLYNMLDSKTPPWDEIHIIQEL